MSFKIPFCFYADLHNFIKCLVFAFNFYLFAKSRERERGREEEKKKGRMRAIGRKSVN